jgi:protein SPA2
MEALLEEVKELASHNEELSNSKDADLSTIRELEEQVADYRKKYERAKTELRGLKGARVIY